MAFTSSCMRLRLAYFDTSAWNDLVDHAESEAIVAELGARAVVFLASVISAGEILRPDMWQVVYLGVAEAFVSSDQRLLEAAQEVSKTFRYPRCVISTRDFLDGITASHPSHRCPVCGSSALIGLHALERRHS